MTARFVVFIGVGTEQARPALLRHAARPSSARSSSRICLQPLALLRGQVRVAGRDAGERERQDAFGMQPREARRGDAAERVADEMEAIDADAPRETLRAPRR